MSEKVKLIIEIPKKVFEARKIGEISPWVTVPILDAVQNGMPFDDVKAEIEQNAYPIVHGVNNHEKGMTLYGILQVLDNIGNAESEE